MRELDGLPPRDRGRQRGGELLPAHEPRRIQSEGDYMKIESGKSYIRRDGVKVGPAQHTENAHYHWRVGQDVYTDSGNYFAADGNGKQAQHAKDLISAAR